MVTRNIQLLRNSELNKPSQTKIPSALGGDFCLGEERCSVKLLVATAALALTHTAVSLEALTFA